jgi:hypothetical protein
MQNAQPAPQERIFPIVMGLAELLPEGPLDVDQLARKLHS